MRNSAIAGQSTSERMDKGIGLLSIQGYQRLQCLSGAECSYKYCFQASSLAAGALLRGLVETKCINKAYSPL